MTYPTLDDIPDLTAQQMAGAAQLALVSRPDPVTGTDFAAEYSGVDLNTAFNTLFRFTAREGAIYDFLSTSFVDPIRLTVYDRFGNAVAVNDEADDPAGVVRQGTTYSADQISDWQAPYAGEFYVDASWHQGSFLKTYSLEIFEDVDTAIAPGIVRVITSNGFVGEVGGAGTIFGTNGFQHIKLAQGDLAFDPSFSRGGDVIEFSGAASEYTIVRSGSSAVLKGDSSTYTIPVGLAGTALKFADGVRTLVYDEDDKMMKIGNQLFDTAAFAINSNSEGNVLPGGANPAATARVFMEEDARVSLGGDFLVIGTTGEERVTYLSGDLVLDPSFNRGGDTLVLGEAAGEFQVRRVGSSVLLTGDDGTVTIPVGTAGMTLDFGGDERVLLFDQASQTVRLDGQIIDANGVVLG